MVVSRGEVVVKVVVVFNDIVVVFWLDVVVDGVEVLQIQIFIFHTELRY